MTAADPIAAMLGRYVDADEIAGAATLVWKDGRVVHSGATGWRDRESLDLLDKTVKGSCLWRSIESPAPAQS